MRPQHLIRARGPVIALLVVALALRTVALGEASVWWDEALAVWAVRKPWIETTLWTAGDVHPPLYFWALWVWRRLVGETEFALRYLTVVFGVLGVAVAGGLGRRFGGPAVGALAVAFVAFSRFEVWWSTEMRMYMLAGLLLALAAYSGVRWASEPSASRRRRWLLAYVLAAVAALHSVYLTAVGVAIVGAGVAAAALASRGATDRGAAPRDRPPTSRGPDAIRDLRPWFVAHVAVVAGTLPWLWLAVHRMQSWTSIRGEPASAAFVARLWATLVATGVSVGIDEHALAAALFWACAFAVPAAMVWVAGRPGGPAVRPQADGEKRPRRDLAPWLVTAPFVAVPPLAVWLATQPRALFYSPSVEARYLLPFAVPVYALAAALLDRGHSSRRRAGIALAVAAMAVAVVSLHAFYGPRRLRDELQTLTLAIASQAEPGDAVVLVSGNRYPVFLYYYDRALGSEASGASAAWDDGRSGYRPPVVPFPDRGSTRVDAVEWEPDLEAVLRDHGRVWLAEVDSHLQDPDGRVEAWLAERLPRLASESYGPNALHLFGPQDRRPSAVTVRDDWPWTVDVAALSDLGWSRTVGLPVTRLRAGDELNVTLWPERGAEPGPSAGRVALWSDDVPGAAVRVLELEAAADAPGARRRAVGAVDDRWPSGRFSVELAVPDGRSARLGQVTVGGTEPVGRDWVPLEADLGRARLVGVAGVPERARPGDVLTIDLLWAVAEGRGPAADSIGGATPSEVQPTVFAHLVGPPRPGSGDVVWGAGDGPPSSGGWPDRDVSKVLDRHLIEVDGAAPDGVYEVEVGLYDPVGGERFAVTGTDADAANQRVVVGRVRVER